MGKIKKLRSVAVLMAFIAFSGLHFLHAQTQVDNIACMGNGSITLPRMEQPTAFREPGKPFTFGELELLQ